MPSATQLGRIISTNRSPIYSYFNETLAGASVIRAFGEENQFMDEMQRRVDAFQQVDWADIAITGLSIHFIKILSQAFYTDKIHHIMYVV